MPWNKAYCAQESAFRRPPCSLWAVSIHIRSPEMTSRHDRRLRPAGSTAAACRRQGSDMVATWQHHGGWQTWHRDPSAAYAQCANKLAWKSKQSGNDVAVGMTQHEATCQDHGGNMAASWPRHGSIMVDGNDTTETWLLAATWQRHGSDTAAS